MFDWIRKRRKTKYLIVFTILKVDDKMISPNSLTEIIYDFCEKYNIKVCFLTLASDECGLYVKCSELQLNNIIKELFGKILTDDVYIVKCKRY